MPIFEMPEFPRAKIFIGGCIERGEGSSIRRSGHAHNDNRDPNFGAICIKGKTHHLLRLHNGEPTNLLKHEYAHILCNNQGHTLKFFLCLYAIGGYIERDAYGSKDYRELCRINPARAKWDDVKDALTNDTFVPPVPSDYAKPKKAKKKSIKKMKK